MPAHIPVMTAYLICYFCVVSALLMARVILGRQRLRVAIGAGDQPEMMRLIRAHGNFTENAPLAALAFLVAELLSARPMPLLILGVLIAIARTLSAWGITKNSMPNKGRVLGAALTMFYFVAISGLILFSIYEIPN